MILYDVGGEIGGSRQNEVESGELKTSGQGGSQLYLDKVGRI
jgi:hypothetical protein